VIAAREAEAESDAVAVHERKQPRGDHGAVLVVAQHVFRPRASGKAGSVIDGSVDGRAVVDLEGGAEPVLEPGQPRRQREAAADGAALVSVDLQPVARRVAGGRHRRLYRAFLLQRAAHGPLGRRGAGDAEEEQRGKHPRHDLGSSPPWVYRGNGITFPLRADISVILALPWRFTSSMRITAC